MAFVNIEIIDFKQDRIPHIPSHVMYGCPCGVDWRKVFQNYREQLFQTAGSWICSVVHIMIWLMANGLMQDVITALLRDHSERISIMTEFWNKQPINTFKQGK